MVCGRIKWHCAETEIQFVQLSDVQILYDLVMVGQVTNL